MLSIDSQKHRKFFLYFPVFLITARDRRKRDEKLNQRARTNEIRKVKLFFIFLALKKHERIFLYTS